MNWSQGWFSVHLLLESSASLNLHNDICQLTSLWMFSAAHGLRTPTIAAAEIQRIHAKLHISHAELPWKPQRYTPRLVKGSRAWPIT